MRLLTATGRTQGWRPNDFNACIEGELVMPPTMVCARDQDDPDGACGCGRAWAGLASHRATTTAVVQELPGISREDYVEAIRSSLGEQGWPTGESEEIADVMIEIAAEHRPGTVLEQRLGEIAARPEVP